ncbi:MAG: transposase [Acidobacteriota bacterium]
MNETFASLLDQQWVLDLDATVKTLYGRQEEARVGYNPMKPGRPSHVYHAMVLTAAKLVLNVDAEAGNRIASTYSQPSLWGWLESRDRKDWPTLVRGDIAYGNEEMMAECEERKLAYLFQLRQTKRVGQMIGKLARQSDQIGWRPAGQGWEGVEQELQLQGWTVPRRVIVLRRKLKGQSVAEPDPAQLMLPGFTLEHKGGEWYEHAVLITNWVERELLAVTQMYRDRSGAENLFDELKNQWGWTGFSTQDLKRSQLMARLVALIYNWWSIFTRMGTGNKHGDAITTRPLLQQAIAKKTTHANQTKLSISSLHAKARKAANLLSRISAWMKLFAQPAEQLGGEEPVGTDVA